MTRDVTITEFTIPLTLPLNTAAGTIDERRGYLLDVDGAYGEATPLPGWTESRADCRASLNGAQNLLSAGASWDAALEACAGYPAARHAVELAHLDATATEAGEPIARFLDADASADVAVNATIGEAPSRETCAHARRAVTNGYDCLKIKVGGRPVPGDVERIRDVRTEVGTEVELRADANGSWTPGQAREALDAFDDLDVRFVEQPLPADEIRALAELNRSTAVDIAVDETLATHDLGDVLMAGAADVVILKPMALGGIKRAKAIADRARDHDVTPIITTTIDAVIARTGALHLAASLGDIPACGLATADRLATDLADDPAPVRNGTMTVPSTPGLGVDYPEVPDA